jgi:P-type Ca2+ transporter type 2C
VGLKMETTFDPENITGLSEEEAAGILKNDGYNELPSQKKTEPVFHLTECS